MIITLRNGNSINVIPSDPSVRHAQLLGDDWVELRFETPYYIDIEPGSSVEFGGRTYWVERPQDVTIRHRRNFEYTARFDSSAARLKYLPFINPDDGRVTFAVTGNANVHLALLVRAANGISAQAWTAGNTVYDSREVTVSYDSMSLWEALSLLADSFGTEYEVDGTAIYLRKVEYNKSAPLILSYGYGNGLKSGIQRSNNGDFPPVLAVAVKGGNRNINTSSNQSAYGAKTLHMPGPGVVHGIPNIIGFDGEKFAYMDGYSAQGGYHYDKETGFDDTSAKYYETSGDGRMLYYAGADAQNPTMPSLSAGTNVEIIDLSHIYPQKEHTVTAVTSQQKTAQAQDGTTETYLEYTVEFATDIDYHDAMIPGSSSLTVIFQSGQLAGRKFDANFVQPWQTGDVGKFVIISKFIDDERMPGGTFVPAVGNRFRVFNCMLPQQYIRDDSDFSGAEWDMAREAVRHMWAYGGSSYRWDADLSTVFAAGMTEAQFAKVRVGGYVSFSDPDVQPQQLLVRIAELRQPLNHERRAEIVLEEYSRLRYRRRGVAMKDSVQRLEAERVDGVVQTGAYNNTHMPSYEDLEEVADSSVGSIIFDRNTYTPSGGVVTLPNLKTVDGQTIKGNGAVGTGRMYGGVYNGMAQASGLSVSSSSRYLYSLQFPDGKRTFSLNVSNSHDNVFVLDNSGNKTQATVTVNANADIVYSTLKELTSITVDPGQIAVINVLRVADAGRTVAYISANSNITKQTNT